MLTNVQTADPNLEALARLLCREFDLPVSRVPRIVATLDKHINAGVDGIMDKLLEDHRARLDRLNQLGKWTPEIQEFFESRKSGSRPETLSYHQFKKSMEKCLNESPYEYLSGI